MGADFSKSIYRGYIIKGDLTGAINYVKQFPSQAELYQRFMEVFEREQYTIYEADAGLNELLLVYQRYYRDVFYLCLDREKAEDRLRAGLAGCLGMGDESMTLCDMEEHHVAEAFQRQGLYFLGGRTSGYYGPYIWRTTQSRTYEVELPDGIQPYTVKLLDGFVSRSWMDYISFGEIGTGGWSDETGIINCVKSVYDLDGEDFKVSLLKHEAQHAQDLAVKKEMLSVDLEYRAKLVELIYSSQRDMLKLFAQEADGQDQSNGHSAASSRIMEGFAQKLDLSRPELEKLPKDMIQNVAKILFEESAI